MRLLVCCCCSRWCLLSHPVQQGHKGGCCRVLSMVLPPRSFKTHLLCWLYVLGVPCSACMMQPRGCAARGWCALQHARASLGALPPTSPACSHPPIPQTAPAAVTPRAACFSSSSLLPSLLGVYRCVCAVLWWCACLDGVGSRRPMSLDHDVTASGCWLPPRISVAT